ncbi:MAG: hypothetical protein JJE44_09230 [Flavobacteriaceae bacterium]|nr:hypothetical protein [Flavobacteriaceae bacterium]
MDKSKKYNEEVTKEDKAALSDKSGNLRNDQGDDRILKRRKRKVDFEGKDLDIPGRKLPVNRTKKIIKDEENQLYSLGNEDNEDL